MQLNAYFAFGGKLNIGSGTGTEVPRNGTGTELLVQNLFSERIGSERGAS